MKHILATAKVQRHFSRRIPALRELNYGERLALLELDTLELRRAKSDLVLYYKIFNGLSPLSRDHYFKSISHGRPTRSQEKYLIEKPLCKSKVLENDFFCS